ncbi:MAG: tetratricopeptide repeat protein [Chlamydiia bacterium]|nr:tetratricopeptide repeat protein [Chlamydiia bacterium]
MLLIKYQRPVVFFFFPFFIFMMGCHPPSTCLQPKIKEPPHPKETFRETRRGPCVPRNDFSPFPPLTEEEVAQTWAKEYTIAVSFAEDFDLYRAITGFKRALAFLPADSARRLQIQYCIALAYFLGHKYQEAIYQVESGGLICVDTTFPAFDDLLLLLYDCYVHVGNTTQACHILSLIEQMDSQRGDKLKLLSKVKNIELEELYAEGKKKSERAYLQTIVCNYRNGALSIKKAEILNAVLPGAGYFYVGQRETAMTAFLINSLFITGSVLFFKNGNPAAGAIMASLESGWYIGGIWGAGIAARTYNERLYEGYADRITAKEGYFPVMMLRYTF